MNIKLYWIKNIFIAKSIIEIFVAFINLNYYMNYIYLSIENKFKMEIIDNIEIRNIYKFKNNYQRKNKNNIIISLFKKFLIFYYKLIFS